MSTETRTLGRAYDLEAEESVLGSMMLSPSAAAECAAVLVTSDFYRGSHARIFEALLALHGRGEPLDAITAVAELKARGTLEDLGGPLRIHELVELVPSPAAGVYYARIVADCSALRKIGKIGEDLQQLASVAPGEEGVAEALSRAESKLLQAVRARRQDDPVPLGEVVDEIDEEIQRITRGEAPRIGTLTGFRDVDRTLGGLWPGQFVIIAARPGVGKSALVGNIARNVAKAGQPVLFVSLEMGREEIVQRLVAGISGQSWRAIREDRGVDWSRVGDALVELQELPLYILDEPSTTLTEIRSMARRFKAERGLGLVVVDYLQLMAPAVRGENRQQEITEFSRSLKLLAKEIEAPVIAVSQLNRNSEFRAEKRPQLSDLRESGSLEQDADIVGMLYHESRDKPIELHIAKHRNGSTGTIPLTFLSSLTDFRDYVAGGEAASPSTP